MAMGSCMYWTISRRPSLRYVHICPSIEIFTLLTTTKGLDTTIAADVQASVYERFGHIENLPWVGLGFPMASVAVILALGRAYGLFDVKILILSSIFIFEIGSAICGAAPTSDALIVGRVIAGIGGAGMYLG
jgi:MFS family permease